MSRRSSAPTQGEREQLVEAQQRLAAIVEGSDDAIISKTLDGTITSWNSGATRLYGYTAAEMIGRPISMLIPPDQPDELPTILARLARGERIDHFETRRQHKNGTLLDISLTISPIRDAAGHIVGASAIARDITERTRLEMAMRQSASFFAGQKRVLDEIIQGASLARVLDTLARVVEEQAGRGLIASILLLDETGTRLLHGAAPSLPAGYNSAIDGLAIGPAAGSCGTAAYRREPVVVVDIAGDPLWDDYRHLALDHGLRACWSTPILGSDGGVLGTFALYHREPHRPDEKDRELVQLTAHTAALAIERARIEAERTRLLAEKESDRAAAERERIRLWEVFQQAPVILAVLEGPEHRFTVANPLFLEAVGRDGLLGRPIREALPEVVGQSFAELLDQVFATGEPHVGTEAPVLLDRRGTGVLEEGFFDFVYQPLTDASGRVTGILVCGVEVTEVRRTRRALERQHHLVETITSNAALALFMTDRHQHCTVMNPAAEQMTGFTLAELRDRPLHSVLHHTRPDGTPYPIADCPIDSALHTQRQTQGEDAFIHKDGYFYPIAFTASPIFEDGAPVGTVLEVQDITARQAAEREREALLERERRARTEAEAANRAKDEFLSVLSHELRTPLTPILGFLGMLKRPSLTEERRRVALETIERSAHAEARLVDDLLDVSRIVAGKLLLERELTDLEPIMMSAVETVQPSAEAKGVTLSVDAQNVALPVHADAGRLQQVIWNLLANAVKFTPPGGQIAITLQRRDDSAILSVRDTGVGIDPDHISVIFDRFRQADASSTRVHGGLGLGLTIVRHLVEEHGGTVTAESPGEGQGATFTIRLPLHVEDAPIASPSGHAGVSAMPALAGRHVLVVDDDESTRLWLQAALEMADADVVLASSGPEALALLEDRHTDLLLVDLAMPGMDGYAFLNAARVRAGSSQPLPPAVAFTAHASTEDRKRATTAGFAAHVAKPAIPDTLLEVLAGVLGGNHT
jgi:PAS domain S-box-containing protein